MKGSKVLAGVGWSGAATIVNLGAQLLVMAALARLLEPAAFGLMAMTAIALRFASYFADLGLGQALMQKPELTDKDASAALTLAIVVGSVLYVLVVLASRPLASLFHSPGLRDLLPVVGATLLVGPIANIPLALLRRRSQFARAAAIEVASYVIGYGLVGVGCAAAGLGVLSLALGTLGQPLVLIALGFLAARLRLASAGVGEAMRHFWHFGTRYSVIGFLEFVTGSLESFYIGRWIGEAPLGMFNRAQAVTSLPVELATGAGIKVVLPALSTLQHDRDRLIDGFLVLLLFSALISFPLSCGIAAAHADLVDVLLGHRWGQAASVVAVLALAAPPAFLYRACGVTLDSVAALRPKLALQSFSLLLKIALIAALARYGLLGIAVSTVAMEYVRVLLGFWVLKAAIGVPVSRCLVVAGAGGAAGALVYAAAVAAAFAGPMLGLPGIGRLALDVLCCGVAALAAFALLALRFPNYAPIGRFASLEAARSRLYLFARPWVSPP